MKKTMKTPDPGESESGFLPGLAIDAVIFGFHEKQLRILILEYRNTGLFALPGGFITENEDLDDSRPQNTFRSYWFKRYLPRTVSCIRRPFKT